MGAIIPYDRAYQAGRGVTQGLADIAQGARKFACSLYRTYPKWIGLDPLGFGSFQQGLWDQICDEPPPTPQFPPPASVCPYIYSFSTPVANLAGPQPYPNDVSFNSTVSHGYPRARPFGNGVVFDNINPDGSVTSILDSWGSQRFWEAGYGNPSLISIRPFGSACVEPRPVPVPTFPDVVPPPIELQVEVPVTVAPNVQITTPITYVRPNFDISPDFNTELNFNPTFNLPDLNLTLEFTFDGIRFENYLPPSGQPQPQLPPDPRPNPPGKPRPPGSDGGDCDLTPVLDELDGIKDLLEAIKLCACDTPTVVRSRVLGEANSGTFPLPNRCFAVRVTLTVDPPSLRSQSGGNAPDVLFAGWASFVSSGGQTERLPVDHRVKTFIADSRATAFSYTIHNGGSASAVAFFLEEIEQP